MPKEPTGPHMGEPETANALRRKTSVGQRAREVQGLTPTRALRIALARAAGDLWELPLSVTSISQHLVPSEALPGMFDEDAMMLLLDGPDGVRGGLVVDRALLTSVTEVQTIGEVRERPPSDRPYTPTDAALFAPLADAMLERMDLSLSAEHEDEASFERSEAAWALGFRFGAKVERKRNLLLALEGEAFHVLRMDIDIAAGMRQGTLVLCLPDDSEADDVSEPDVPAVPGAHADALASVTTKLQATLERLTLPLSKATGLKVGDVLPMGQDALQNVTLRASDGQSMARCTLGKIGDMRALRLHPPRGQRATPPPPDEEVAGFSAGLRSSASDDEATERFVPHDRGASPQEPQHAVATDEVLPDLPPLDFDAPLEDESLAPPDVGNANFE